ncbi:FAD-dependent oxidoreductase [Aliarcobacter butzleri]|uniref:FAD-dependent oxidoreductase n=1 Tax=Aliarcobacter butzleri TaxID=28197 RepID=UPI00063A9F15|nr:FAD-dependent oxidoreductase [Aliarcobacter butzleri]
MKKYDCIVIGGGFFGSTLGLFLKEYFDDVVVLEQENDILQRASYVNQARVHMGYHYPRSLVTAFRSLANFPKFIKDFEKAIKNDFDKFYAIAKVGSKVNANQFYEIYKKMGAPINKAQPHTKALFNDKLIDEVFKVKEFAFDSKILKEIVLEKFEESKCELRVNTKVKSIEKNIDETINVYLENDEPLNAKFVFNCTYSGLNTVLKNSNLPLLNLKHEITEMSLIELPDELKNFSITVMDGPFFSIMPFPSIGLNTLSHVRYTPHGSWIDKEDYYNGYKILKDYEKKSNFRYMINDAKRYIPLLEDAIYKNSIYEVKTVQVKNETDDGRPILFTKDYEMKNFSNIMGGKIDNIYEILDTIKETKEFLGIKKRHFWNIFSKI